MVARSLIIETVTHSLGPYILLHEDGGQKSINSNPIL